MKWLVGLLGPGGKERKVDPKGAISPICLCQGPEKQKGEIEKQALTMSG